MTNHVTEEFYLENQQGHIAWSSHNFHALQNALAFYKKTMPGNKPLSREEFRAYLKERDRLNKAYETAQRTVKVMYKSLCPACEYNASHGKKIIYNCPHCKVRYWNNCSKIQVRNGQLLAALQAKYGNIEWMKAYNPDGSLFYDWKRHESRYKQDIDGKWVPKD